MYRSIILAFGILISVASLGSAVDLTQIDRSPPKLPVLQSAHPEYCLLVFGADAHKRVWLVRDGNVLYVDRNGNGDLTDPDERVEANREESNFDDGILYFHAGNIPDGERLHKDLRVNVIKMDHMVDEDPRIKALLAVNPKWRDCTMSLDVDIPGQHGGGIDGRVVEQTSWQDQNGFLQFSLRPEAAPIIHFDSPWEVTFYDMQLWHIGGYQRVDCCLGSPGLGPGTTAFVDYQGVIPLEIKPNLKVTFPATADKQPIEKTYVFDSRCCGIDLYGSVDVPAEAAPGFATVEISVPSWPGVSPAPTRHQVPIAAALFKEPMAAEPVSAGITRRLQHSNHEMKRDSIVGIRFSPDGKQIIAGDYPGGAVNVWETESGNRLTVMETGKGLRSSTDYFSVSPDWKTVYAGTNRRGRQYEKVEVGGKPMFRISFDDAIQVFDLASGRLTIEWKHFPPHEIRTAVLSENGRYVVADENLPGDSTSQPQNVITFWDTATYKPRTLPDSYHGLERFSSDCRLLAVAVDRPDEKNCSGSVKLIDVATMEERSTLKLPVGHVIAWPCAFCLDGKVCVVRTGLYAKPDDYQHSTEALRFYDVKTSEELFEVSAVEKDEGFYPVTVSHDGRFVAAAEQNSKVCSGRLMLVDAENRHSQHMDFGENTLVTAFAFDPSSERLAVYVLSIRPEQVRSEVLPTELSSPHVHIIDVATGKTVQTLVMPQCNGESLAFSPDGKILASSGAGEVLLWDVSQVPPDAN